MVPEKLEYAFILLLYTLLGLSLGWDGLLIALRRRQSIPTILLFTIYCLGIEIVALNLGWWSFNPERIIGILIWRIPVEELVLFPLFALLTLSAWEMLTNDEAE